MDIHNWIMDIHNSIMDLHNYGVLSPLALHSIRLSVSTANRTYELSGITHVTPFPRKTFDWAQYSRTYEPWVSAYNNLSSCESVLDYGQ